MKLSLVIPCYNEEGNIQLFFEETSKVFCDKPYSYECVFVNDGSTDHTRDILNTLLRNHTESNITVVNFSRNFGKEAAIYAGMQHCTGDYICLIDADLQQRPEVALEMLEKIEQNPDYDCITAFQAKRKEGKVISALKKSFYRLINKMSETDFHDAASDFRLFKRKVKDSVLSLGEYHRFSKGIFSWIGYNVFYMPYEVQERNSGESKWHFWKLFKYALNGIISFSTVPLKLATYIGGVSTILSIVYLIITIIRKLVSDINVDGFTQIVILITFFSGVLLFTVGIIGEYIARIYQQVKNRPIYIADEVAKNVGKGYENDK